MDTTIKILILEDTKSDADLLVRELKRSGFTFISELVETREAYENALRNFKPDLILSDYNLPAFDGETAFDIKQEITPDLPFIIVSSAIGDEKAVELIKKGVTDYALKDKLFSLIPKINRAMKEAEEKKEKIITDEKLKFQNEKLFEIAFLQSHQVRRPVANLLGLIGLFNFSNPNDPINSEVLSRLKVATNELDNVIAEIVKKTDEIKRIT